MLLDDSDDKPVLPGDVLATFEEIAEAAAHARSDPAVRPRLIKAAEYIWATSRQVKRTCQPEDLLQDAIEAVLDGRRKWPKNRVDFRWLLVGTMRSMVSSREKTLATKPLHVTMEHELHLHGESPEPQNLEETAADPETIESGVLRKEQEAAEESQLANLRSKYGPTDLHGLILDKAKDGFSSHAEIREALGVADNAYWNAWKVLMRAAEKLNSCAKE